MLVSDAALPSVAGLVAKTPIRGSWWAHPDSHAIFRVAEALARRPDIITAKVISGKVTFVHRKLWPALLTLATSRESWQVGGLSALARSLLSRVTREGTLRVDHLARSRKVNGKALGEAARRLEERLLVYSESIHTESGKHVKQLESWAHLAKRLRINRRKLTPETAKKEFEEIRTALEERSRAAVQLPWTRTARG